MKHFMIYLFVFFCVWGECSLAIAETQWDGEFSVEELGEKLNDGSQVFLRYDFKINSKNNHAFLSMTTWHAGIPCIGDYYLKTTSDILELYYSNIEKNACPYPSPQFKIKIKGNKYYIKSRLFAYAGRGKWLPLEHITSK